MKSKIGRTATLLVIASIAASLCQVAMANDHRKCKSVDADLAVIANGDGSHREMGHGAGPCMLHNPSYDFNDDLIPLGATYWVRLAEDWLKTPREGAKA